MDKYAASRSSWQIAKSRIGRRPISVSALLKKDKAGTLLRKHSSYGDTEPLWMETDVGKVDYESKAPVKLNPRSQAPDKRGGDVPSQNVGGIGIRSEDGRSNAVTMHAGATAQGDVVPDAMPSSYKLSCVRELLKLGAVSPEEAQQAMDNIESLQKAAPTPRLMGQYAALGAAAAPVMGALGSVIQKRPYFGDAVGALAKGRVVAGDAVKGAIGMGAIPLARARLQRGEAVGKLKDFMAENAQTAPVSPEPQVVPPMAKAAGWLQEAGEVAKPVWAGVKAAPMGAAKWLHKYETPIDAAGLGYLAAPSIDNIQAKLRAGSGANEHTIEQKRLIPEKYHDFIEASGLGALAAPAIAKRVVTGKWTEPSHA